MNSTATHPQRSYTWLPCRVFVSSCLANPWLRLILMGAACAALAWLLPGGGQLPAARLGLFGLSLAPLAILARGQVFAAIEDGAFVLDAQGHVTEMNPAGQHILQAGSAAAGQSSKEFMFYLLERAAELPAPGASYLDIEVGESVRLFYRLRAVELDQDGEPVGRVLLVRDVTEAAGLARQVEELAIHDTLTGAYNRRHFWELARHQLKYVERHPEHSVAIFMIDIDQFAAINDRYGHECGDQALAGFVEICRTSIRTMDALGRLGGDEFAVLLEDIDYENTLLVAERIRQNIARARLTVGEEQLQLSACIGVTHSSELETGKLNVNNLINLASRSLFYAKEQGPGHMVAYRASSKHLQ